MQTIEHLAYDVRLKVENDRLRYVITGERCFSSTLALWQKIYDDCAEFQINKVHATVLLTGQLDKMDIPLLINKLIKLNDSTPINCAWVDHNFKSYLDNLVGEKIPRPGSMNIRIFNNDAEANDWLAQL